MIAKYNSIFLMFYIDFIFKWGGAPQGVFTILTLQKRKGKALKLKQIWSYHTAVGVTKVYPCLYR